MTKATKSTAKKQSASKPKKQLKLPNDVTTFRQGSAKATHKMSVIFDPNCICCHDLYEAIEKDALINDKKLQVRWVAVGFLHSTSMVKSAMILSGATDEKKCKLLHKDEKFFIFNAHKESGGLPAKSGSINKSLVNKVGANTVYFLNNFEGTPTLIYKNKSDKLCYQCGINPKTLSTFLKKVSNKW